MSAERPTDDQHSGAGGAIIRPARIEDAPGIAAVHVASWNAAYRGLLPTAGLLHASAGVKAEGWRRIIASREVVLVAEKEGRIQGFATMGAARYRTPYTAELYMLYLLPEEQGQGLGRRLFDEAAGSLIASAHLSMMLWVVSGNRPARRFYEAMGGKLFAGQSERLWGGRVPQVAYGWADLRLLRRRIATTGGGLFEPIAA